jgi:glycosyltransferase involved in cell wall biosynthesis
VVTVSEPLTQYFARTYGLDASRAVTITHGFDPDEWSSVETVERADGRMRFVHTGSFSFSRATLDIRTFVSGVSLLSKELAESIEIVFVGNITAEEKRMIDAAGVHCIRIVPPVSRAKSLGYQRSADALLLIYAPELSGASTKTFEYLYSGRPILAVGLPDAAGVRIVIDSGAGSAADVREPRQIADRITEMFELWRRGRLETAARNVDRYHRRTLAGKLAAVLKSAVVPKRVAGDCVESPR